MKNLKTTLGISAVAVCGIFAASSSFAQDGSDPSIITKVHSNPITHKPFNIDDLVCSDDPQDGLQKCKPFEPLEIKIDGKIMAFHTAEEFLVYINDIEKRFNQYGQTLRQNGEITIESVLANHDELLKQLGQHLDAELTIIKSKVKDALTDCRQLNITDLGINIHTDVPFTENDRVEIEEGVSMLAKDFVIKINEQQNYLCQLGYSLLEKLDSWQGAGTNISGKLLDFRLEMMDFLGISKFNTNFNFGDLSKKLPEFKDIALDLADILKMQEFPSFERLYSLANKINLQLPEDLQTPDIPNIPAVTVERRMDLKLKKRKDWKGFDFGEKKKFKAYANAFYEIRGSEVEQQGTAEGKAGIWVLNHELNALSGAAQLTASPENLQAILKLRVLGKDLVDIDKKEELSIKIDNPKALHHGIDLSYTFHWPVWGPIALDIETGVVGEVYMGWKLGISIMNLDGHVIPGASINAFGDAGISVGNVLGAGAGGELVIINDKIDLVGYSKIRFSEGGLPTLNLGINADNQYTTLAGSVYGYVKYPVPRWGIPPWKTKKSRKNLWSFKGYSGKDRIINYDLMLSPFEQKTSGASVDATDREEAKKLQENLALEQRAQEIGKVAQKTNDKKSAVFGIISDDLKGQGPLSVAKKEAEIKFVMEALEEQRKKFLKYLSDQI